MKTTNRFVQFGTPELLIIIYISKRNVKTQDICIYWRRNLCSILGYFEFHEGSYEYMPVGIKYEDQFHI
jgi:hypothetical protein